MPWVRFTRTPTAREKGVRPYVLGGVYELSDRQVAHWSGLGAIERAEDPDPMPREVDEDEEEPAADADVDGDPPADAEPGVATDPTARTLRSQGFGKTQRWHVYEGAERITDKALTRAEAEELAAAARATGDDA